MKIKHIFFVITFFALTGLCYSQETSSSDPIIINIDNITGRPEPIFLSTLFDDYKIIPLETSDECLMGNISKVLVYDNKIFVLDSRTSKRLFIFDMDGRFIKKIGQSGKGPHEFLSPNDFAIDYKKNQIVILCSDLRKVMFYDIDGNYLTEKPLNDSGNFFSICIEDDPFISKFPTNETDYLVTKYDFKNNVKKQYLQNNIVRKGFKLYITNSVSDFCTSPEIIRYSKKYMNTVYKIENSIISPYLTLKTENGLTEKDVKSINMMHPMTFMNSQRKKMLGVQNYLETKDVIFIEYCNNDISYHIFYDLNSHKYKATIAMRDDLAKLWSVPFIGMYNNGLISTVNNFSMEDFMKRLENGEVMKGVHLDDISINSNPVLIFYDYKD